jgi:hypothetical protein
MINALPIKLFFSSDTYTWFGFAANLVQFAGNWIKGPLVSKVS